MNDQPIVADGIAWITGASHGIGFACAEALGSEGYQIALSGRNRDALEAAQLALTKRGVSSKAFPCDVQSEARVQETYHMIAAEFGSTPHLLLNCAGVSPWTTFTETPLAEFDSVIATNTRGMFLTSREVLPAMYERGSGAIVQLISIAGIKAFKNGAAYVASKFAALGFTNALREEARAHGVRVIAVFPGATETEIWDAEAREQYHDRMMQPEDIAQAIVSALKLPARAMMEELVLRPQLGDL
ncbi:MAG: SDR family oxidoreductase [Bacteroidota bacterium]|nr:SDR family oxidoreductase [Bacteroidota bacterium]MDP4234140.1 SDR family oxidoreductase [Bacteroidota bacterium]MDP4244077.1 SDR family oxidoreductase [Bacteroidota bacterium]MDP4289231.1 SDR family oxidoreductase [Bacteroidota bacterium]